MSFNKLPIEIQAEILKCSIYQRCIKKSLNQYNLSLFRDNIGNRPVSKKEFLNYFNQYKPDYFIFQKNSIDVLRKINEGYSCYCLNLWSFCDELTLFITKYSVDNIEIMIRQMDDIYYDLFTTFRIIENRKLNDKEYVLNQFIHYSNIPDITNIKSLNVFGNAYLYVDINLKILDNSFNVGNYDFNIKIKDVKSKIPYYNEMKQLLKIELCFKKMII